MGVVDKLASIQSELFVPKNNQNDFGNYPYRSCEDILKTVKPLCAKYKCLLHISNDLECIGNRNYVKATVKLMDLETGETIESTAHAREEETKKGMDGSQITGASSSYARKYALAGLFCIDNEKDSDATYQPLDAKVEKAISFIKTKTEAYKTNVLGNYKLDKLEDMTREQAENFIETVMEKGK